MIAIAFFALTAENFQERFSQTLKDRIIISLLLFYFMHFLWMAGTHNIEAALLKVKDFKYILYALPILLITRNIFIPKIIIALICGVMLSESVSYAMYFGIAVPKFILIENNPLNVPFMESYTQYAIVLNLIAGILLHRFLISQSKLLLLLLFLLTSLNIFIIESRIGYALYFLTVFIVLFNFYKQHFFKVCLYFSVVIMLVGSGAWIFSDSFQTRIYLAIDDINKLAEDNLTTSLGARTGLYLFSYDMIKSNILFGVGTADHIENVMDRIVKSDMEATNKEGLLANIRSGHNASLHSEYLDLLGQFGIIGLLIFLNIFYQIARYPQENPYYRTIQLLIIATVLFVSFGTVIFIASQVGKIIILLLSLTLLTKADKTPIALKP